MEKEITNVSLSFPCQEKWNDLVVKNNHKFCEKCQHAVIDFTGRTAGEFQQALKTSTSRVCGRFKRSQMSARFLKYAAATAIAASSVACTPDVITPLLQEAEILKQSIEMEDEQALVGVVLLLPEEDSIAVETDPTLH